MSRKLFNISTLAGLVAASLSAWSPAAVSGSVDPDSVGAQYKPVQVGRYKPLQPIIYEFGSKSMSGLFVEQAAQCFVTLMVTERSNSYVALPITAARVRIAPRPGQIVGLDSAELHSLNFICGDNAQSLLVDFGETDVLVARQTHAGAREVAKTQ